jgi:Spermidine synthase tetramerisation domain
MSGTAAVQSSSIVFLLMMLLLSRTTPLIAQFLRQIIFRCSTTQSSYKCFSGKQHKATMTENGESKVTIDAQRAKMAFLFREDIAPGLRLEMDLNRIFFTSESDFQQIDVVETYFGKVRGPLLRL